MAHTIFLRDILKKKLRVSATCGHCGRVVELWPGPLIELLGYNYPLPSLSELLLCTICGKKEALCRPTTDNKRYNNMVPGCELRPPD
ncbi:MAG: hypothetical protein ABJN40_22925 [Sneathiella sp.]